MSEKKEQKFYTEEFKRQAVELMIHSGRSIVQLGRELGVSEASLYLWRKRYGVAASSPGQTVGAGAACRLHALHPPDRRRSPVAGRSEARNSGRHARIFLPQQMRWPAHRPGGKETFDH